MAKEKKETKHESNKKPEVKQAVKGDGRGLGFFVLKILFIAVLGAFLVFIYRGEDVKDVSLEDIETALTEKTEITKVMDKASDRDLMQFIGLNAPDYDEYIYYRNTTALAVDELLIVKSGDDNKVKDAEGAVRKRIDAQINAYQGYGPEQVQLLKSATVKKLGPYLIYITAKDATEYEEVILNVIQ